MKNSKPPLKELSVPRVEHRPINCLWCSLFCKKIAALTIWGFSVFKNGLSHFFSPTVAIFNRFLVSLFWLPHNTPYLLKPAAAASLHNLLLKTPNNSNKKILP